MFEWILDKLPAIIFVVIFIAQVLRGFTKMRGSREEPPPLRDNELDEHRRQQEIQKEIRRKIAERRAGRSAAPESPKPAAEDAPRPPVEVERDPTAIPPLPEPLRRMLEQLERKAQPPPVPPPVPGLERRTAELERQERLAEEMRTLEEARSLAAKRAAQIAAMKAEQGRSEGALRTAARGRLVDDLRDPESLRRAFVLREVLGPPVGLRQ